MAPDKITAVLTALILLSGIAAAANFNVNVNSEVQSSYYEFSYSPNASTVHQTNVTIENRGSIGCTFRMKGVYSYKGKKFTRYSRGYEIWPGQSELAKLYFMPVNYTGPVDVKVSTFYCDRSKELANFTFNMTHKLLPKQTLDSATEKVGIQESSVKVDSVDNGLLVPLSAPPYWKAGSADIRKGEAKISYEAPIFRKGAKITYAVLDNQSRLVGKTTVKLEEPQPTALENLESNLVYIFLAVSIALNGALILRRLDNREK
ncbi:MAG: hypothetical protein ABEJ99_01385 [Candidatus Nanohaloarchaea archaeon]